MLAFSQIKRRPIAVIAALVFISFFVWIVAIADKADGVPWWSFIDQIPFGDKIGHLGLIGTLSLLCNLAFTRWESARPVHFISRTTWVLLVFLTIEELSQAFIPHRHLEFLDWLADLAGLAIGQTVARALSLKSPRRPQAGGDGVDREQELRQK
jgi:hypothetical protein